MWDRKRLSAGFIHWLSAGAATFQFIESAPALATEASIVQVLIGPVTNSANSHLYYLLSESSWTAAEAKAQAMGGHLATVNDQAENDWLLAAFAVERNLWIGLNDVQQEGVFVWSSGEPLTFTNWSPGEPNNAVGGESFGELLGAGNGKWNDLPDDHPDVTVFGVVELEERLQCVGSPLGLVGWWPGDGNATDLTGNDDGTSNNVVFARGRVGDAFRFIGSNALGIDSYVLVPFQPAFRDLTNVTLECWIWNDPNAPFSRLLTLTPDWAVLSIDATGLATFSLRFGDLAATATGQVFQDITVTASNKLSSATWHLITATYNGESVQLYVDGLLAGSKDGGGTMDSRGAGVGLYINFFGTQAQGLIDEVAVYNRALTGAEVQSHFAAGSAGMCKAPRITDIMVLFPGTARLNLVGPPSSELHVQSSSNLVEWSLLETVNDFTGRAQVFDLNAGAAKWRFYRAQQPR